MTTFKRSLRLVSGALALAALAGCMTGNDSEGGSSLEITTEAEVTDIITPQDSTPGILMTLRTDYSCQDGEVDEDETAETFNYGITGGFLYLWKGSSCTAMKFSGTSSSIKGTWTSTDLSARIPAKYRSAICDTAELEDNQYEEFMKDAIVIYTISSSKIKGSVKGEFCYGAVVAEQFEDYPDVEVTSSDCSTVKLTNEDVERTATITVGLKDNKLTQTIAYNGKTCKLSMPVYLNAEEPTCSEEADEALEEEYEAFQECVEDSEFNDDFSSGTVTKSSSQIRSSILDVLKRARPF